MRPRLPVFWAGRNHPGISRHPQRTEMQKAFSAQKRRLPDAVSHHPTWAISDDLRRRWRLFYYPPHQARIVGEDIANILGGQLVSIPYIGKNRKNGCCL